MFGFNFIYRKAQATVDNALAQLLWGLLMVVPLLIGAATGYSSRCDLCNTRATDVGVGANVRLNDRWAVNVRGDMRVGGAAADLPLPMFGAGITRTWGSR